jgi:benzoyl-CoA reductase/2-hydroxyglutaryl-CoA dehydratase subunit BcrC/BadD/HgdB
MSEINIEQAPAKELLAHFQQKLDEEACERKKNGQLVCWSASVAPPEMCVAMDIAMVYPETHAAGIAARKGSPDMLDVAGQKGHSIDQCSYARVNFGYLELLKEYARTGAKPEKLAKSPAADVPLPDLVITCNNICNTLLKWYENIAADLRIPCIIIDVPFNHDMPVPDYAKRYIVKQFEHAIVQLEGITGKKFDYEKFLEVQKQTQRSVAQWKRIQSFLKYQPSPLNGFDFFNYMALIVCARSRDYAEITFRRFADELEQKEKNGVYAFGPNEKSRVTWEGIAVWPHLSHTFKALKSAGSLMTGSAYPGMWNLEYTPGDLMSMAEAYTRIYINTCLENRAGVLASVAENGKCDGILLHMNRTCKNMTFLNYATAEAVQKKLGIPYAAFDGDTTDPGNFAPAQFDTRVQALCETMASKK